MDGAVAGEGFKGFKYAFRNRTSRQNNIPATKSTIIGLLREQ